MTFSQRVKEEADDYRYFPEPDLPALSISSDWIDDVRTRLPELPDVKVERYTAEWDLSPYEAAVLAEERAVAEWFESVTAAGATPKAAASWMINQLFSLMNEHKVAIDQIRIAPEQLVTLIDLVASGVINQNTGKDVLAEMFATGRDADDIVRQQGLAQISDEAELVNIVTTVLKENPTQVAQFHAGKTQLRGWLGQVMRLTQGKANPALVNEILAAQLDKLAPH